MEYSDLTFWQLMWENQALRWEMAKRSWWLVVVAVAVAVLLSRRR